MPRRSCQQCNQRLPYAARRCARCGWQHGETVDVERARAAVRRRRGVWTVLALLLALGGGAAYLNAPSIANWYAAFAARHLPGAMASLAPTSTDQGAFLYCARQVSREMDGDFSVETFPTLEESHAEQMPDGRYRIVSWVEEAREDGGRVRHAFECTVRHARGRWALDGLRMERYASDGTPPRFAQVAN